MHLKVHVLINGAFFSVGVLLSHRPLRPNEPFEVRLTGLNPRWSSSLCLGVVAAGAEKLHLPVSLLHLRRECWVFAGTGLFYNGLRLRAHGGPNLEELAVGHTVGLMVDAQARLHLLVNGVDQGVAAEHLPDRSDLLFFFIIVFYSSRDASHAEI
jgi:neuralized-like protein 4